MFKHRLNYRRLLCITLVFACLLQVTLPFYAVYAAPNNEAEASQTSIFGDRFLLCTADGFKWVSWEELQQSKQQPTSHQDYQCPLCVAQNLFGKSLAATVASNYIPLITSSSRILAIADDAVIIYTTAYKQSRAPPSITIL